MIYTGTLQETVFDCKYLLNEDMSASQVEDEAESIFDHFKAHPLKFTRLTINNILGHLNRLAAYIRVKEETRPGERSIWSKLKAKVAHFIQYITDKLGKLTYVDKDEDKLKFKSGSNFVYLKTVDTDKSKKAIDLTNEKLSQVPENKRKRGWIYAIRTAKHELKPNSDADYSVAYPDDKYARDEARRERQEAIRNRKGMFGFSKKKKEDSKRMDYERQRQLAELEEIIRQHENRD